MLLLTLALANDAEYRGSDSDMIELRERLRLLDETQRREESKWERAVEHTWTLDIYGCPSNLEASITEEVMLAFAPDIGDSITSILFVETTYFREHVSSANTVAFAHYSNIVAVKKPTCSTPVQSYDLRTFLAHEIAHVRTFNIHNYQDLFPREGRSQTGDKRTLRQKWASLDSCSVTYVGDDWKKLTTTPDGLVRKYGAKTWMEDVATFVEVTNLIAYHAKLDDRALDRLHDAYQGNAQHKKCLQNKLEKANAFRFLDDETADLVREVWASSTPTSSALKTKLQSLRETIHARNREALKDR